MADRQFYSPLGPFTVAELARHCGAELHDRADPERVIRDVAPLESAGVDDIGFLDNKAYVDALADTGAGAVIVAPQYVERAPQTAALLLSNEPYKAYARVAQKFFPITPGGPVCVDRAASVDPTAKVGDGARIAAGAVVGAHVEVGAGATIGPNSVIGDNCVIGEDSWIGPNVTVAYALIGNRVRLHAGVRVGQDGFGFAQDPQRHIKVPQLGRVVIHDDAEIGANTTIDRGSGPDTIIGPGCMIDNLVQIGHNVQMGRGCVIVSQVGISGSTRLGDHVVMAGQVGVAGHLKIGDRVTVAAMSGITHDLEGDAIYGGAPAIPARLWRRQLAAISLLGKGKLRNRG